MSHIPMNSEKPRGLLLPVTMSFLLGVLLAVGVWWAYQRKVAQQVANVSEEVRGVLQEQADAWNLGDLDRFLETYWESDELIFYSGGNISKGHDAVARRYRKNYQAEGKEMGHLTFSGLEVEPLGPDAALARGRWKVVMNKETIDGLFTLVLRRHVDGWKIVHDHTSRSETK